MIDTIILDISFLSFFGFVATWLTLHVGSTHTAETTIHQTKAAAATS